MGEAGASGRHQIEVAFMTTSHLARQMFIAGHRHRQLVRPPEYGDIVVTRIARHYDLGRAAGDGEPIVAMAVKTRLCDALDFAHRFTTGRQRVILYNRAGSSECIEIDRWRLADQFRTASAIMPLA